MSLVFAACVIVAALAETEQHAMLLTRQDCAEILDPATTVEAPGASGGKCVRLSGRDAPDISIDAKMHRGQAVFCPKLPRPGAYRLWVRVQWHCGCGASALLDTSADSATTPSGKEQRTRDIVVASTVAARVWHWIDCGTFQFSEGKQEVRLLQRGHYAMVDGVMLSSDLDQTPPGYTEERQSLAMAECPKEWQTPKAKRVAHRLGEREWSNFTCDFAMDTAELEFRDAASVLGVRFCEKGDGRWYECGLSPVGDGFFGVQATLCSGGKATVLGENKRVPSAGRYHSVRVAQFASQIAVTVDGVPVLEVSDQTLVAGRVSLIAEAVRRLVVREIALQDMGVFEEHFINGMNGWRSAYGDWRTVREQSDVAASMYCLGAGPRGGLAVSKWSLREPFTFTTQLQLLNGEFAGVAFGFVDDRNYSAIALASQDQASPLALSANLLRVTDGVASTASSKPISQLSQSQWHTVSVHRTQDIVSLNVDGTPVAAFSSHDWGGRSGVGLCFGLGAAARFAEIRAREERPSDIGDYIFEPGSSIASISRWLPIRGDFRLDGHPATVTLLPDTTSQEFLLKLRCPLPANRELKVSLVPRRAAKTPSTAQKEAELPLSLPDVDATMLPWAPRIGLVLRRLGDQPDDYRVCVSKDSMRDMVVLHNERVVLRKRLKENRAPTSPQLWVRVQQGRLVAGTQAADEVVLNDPALGGPGDRFEVSFWGDHLSPEDTVAVDGYSILECPSVSSETEVGSNGR